MKLYIITGWWLQPVQKKCSSSQPIIASMVFQKNPYLKPPARSL